MRAFALSATKGREREVERLFLPNQGLEQVPELIRSMDKLQVLDLSGNSIKELPDWLKRLPDLKQLDLKGNRGLSLAAIAGLPKSLEALSLQSVGWSSCPSSLLQLPNLKTLDLRANELLEVPKEIPSHSRLHTLILDNNKLQGLPRSIKRLSKLRKLSLNKNQISRLPSGLGDCQDLTDLQLERNRLTALPTTIGRLEKLENLSVAHNRLRKIPAELANCRMLRKLNLTDNRLSHLPQGLMKLAWLRELDVSGNAMRKCPTVVTVCKRLRKLSLAGNKMKRLVAWPAGGALEELDCSKNQLASVQELGELFHLQALHISNNKIQDFPGGFWRFPQLRTINAQRIPAKVEQRDLMACPQLEELKGLLSNTKQKQLLGFLALSRLEGWTERDRRLFFDLFVKDKKAWGNLNNSTAWRGAQVKDPYFANSFRQFLYKQSARRSRIKEGQRLLILGSLSKEGQTIFASLSNLGVAWTSDQTQSYTHVIFGTDELPPNLPSLAHPWYSEEQLIRQLDRLHGKPWSREITDHQLERLKTLLWNQQEVNYHLALQLLSGSGVPKQLRVDLLALYLRNPFPRFQEKLRTLIFPYLPDLLKMVLASGIEPPTKSDSTKTWKRWLGTREIKAESLIALLQ